MDIRPEACRCRFFTGILRLSRPATDVTPLTDFFGEKLLHHLEAFFDGARHSGRASLRGQIEGGDAEDDGVLGDVIRNSIAIRNDSTVAHEAPFGSYLLITS